MTDSLIQGLALAVAPENLFAVLIGVVIGMVIGVLPGLGPAPTIALLLPLTYGMSPVGAVILLAGVYYGAMYGGTITSVLLRIPGEAASIVTSIDGYEMARRGQGGPALGIAAIGSFIGGTVAVLGLTMLAPMLAGVAVKAGPPEFAALAVLGIVMITYLGRQSPIRSLVMACLGILLATIGRDPIAGEERFTLAVPQLVGGVEIVAMVMGLYGIGEILHALGGSQDRKPLTTRLTNVLPSRQQLRQSGGAIMRGSGLGFLIGCLPGGGGMVSSLASYATEKRRAKNPERFGRGAIEGVAGPESANNASSVSAFIPLLTLGLPSNVVLALIYGALLVQGITPGPFLIADHPDIFWGVVASMYVGNLALLVLSIPLVGVFIQMLRIPFTLLGPCIVMVSLIGVYTVNNNVFDMWVALVFGVLGYVLRRTGFEPAPLILAFILGQILESAFRQSLLLSNGSLGIFVSRPVSGVLIALTVVLAALALVKSFRRHDSGDQELLSASRRQ